MSRFENTPLTKNQSSRVNLNSKHVTTLDFYRLQPVYVQEVIPGDHHSINVSALVEAAPLSTKVYGKCHLDLHAFFVPNRLVWKDWNAYIYPETYSPTSSFTPPSITGANLMAYSGYQGMSEPVDYDQEANVDYITFRRVFGSMGYPTNTSFLNAQNMSYSSLPARVYQKIWWDYYRDPRYIEEASKNSYLFTDGSNHVADFTPRYRTFMRDDITTLLPNPQAGSASTASVDSSMSSKTYTVPAGTKMFSSGTSIFTEDGIFGNPSTMSSPSSKTGKLTNELSIAVLRASNAMQKYLERLNVGGTRTMERALALAGVKPTDVRMGMAEFLGMKTIPITIDGLTNTGSDTAISSTYGNAFGVPYQGSSDNAVGQGFQTGHACSSGKSDSWNYTATEHGFIMVIASIVPDYINPNRVERQFLRGVSTPNHDKFDFYHDDFAGTGYQERLLTEVCTPFYGEQKFNSTWQGFDPWQVVGYESRYADYLRKGDQVSGDFAEFKQRTTMTNMVFTRNLAKLYTPAQVVASLPLTTATRTDASFFDNHFQVTNSLYDHFVINAYFSNNAVRPVMAPQLPTELSDIANKLKYDVSNGGVKL